MKKSHMLFLIAFLVCVHVYTQKAVIIAQNTEDSLFCRQKYPYNFEDNSYIYMDLELLKKELKD